MVITDKVPALFTNIRSFTSRNFINTFQKAETDPTLTRSVFSLIPEGRDSSIVSKKKKKSKHIT